MKMKTIYTALFLGLLASCAVAQNLPIIDMHLHALPADWAGPPPLATCQAFFPFSLPWDPSEPYQDTFVAMHREPPCDDPVWSPMTDEGVMAQTIESIESADFLTDEQKRDIFFNNAARFLQLTDEQITAMHGER